jgi:8-oxo-dGTP diphosphatase
MAGVEHMQQPAQQEPAVAAAVIVRDGRVLLLRRRVQEGALSWQFPAGKIEPGEPPEQTAVRETQEETGLTVAAARLLGRRVHPVTQRLITYVACHAVSESAFVADPEEVADVRWCAHSELSDYVPYGLFEPVQKYLDTALATGHIQGT